jgi:hypothetical protein
LFLPWRRYALGAVVLAAAAAPAYAQPSLPDALPDPRTIGALPPTLTPQAGAPLRPALETPGGGLWLRSEIPERAADPAGALLGATATAGARVRLVTGEGFGWEATPVVLGAPEAAARPGVSAVAPGVGLALGQTLTVSLPFGLRLGATGSIGDRLGIGGPGAAEPLGLAGTSPLAMRAGASLSTDLTLPGLESRLRIGLGIATTGPLPGVAGAFADPREPPECRISLDIGTVGGAPLHFVSPCPGAGGTAAPPISFGFRTAF